MLGRRGFLAALGAVFLPSAARAERYIEPEEAARLLFPQAEDISPFALSLTKDQAKDIKSNSGMRVRDLNLEGFKARLPAGGFGWVYIDNVIGKHEFITYALGVEGGGDSVVGVEIIEYRETWGFEIREAKWRAQFKGLTLRSPIRLGKDIDNISGATLSCRNVTDGVRRLMATHVALGR